ncbi:hypothetical protein EDD17DRAFT_409069 [Pisolithus thermaeus]|nr:hypothetical protein EDD17DRAFT_409069 [Pisolithus thermaeus]
MTASLIEVTDWDHQVTCPVFTESLTTDRLLLSDATRCSEPHIIDDVIGGAKSQFLPSTHDITCYMLEVNLPDRQSLLQAQISSTDESTRGVGVQVANVHPWIARDVEKFVEISIDAMLKAFLVDCDLGSSDEHVLFENCLEAVLPICNGSFQAMDLEVNVSDVQYHLHEHSKKYNENEDELYTDFVKAANSALRCPQSLRVPDI